MPLYKRKPFVSKPVPADLRPDEQIYFLKLTNEIFRDYDEYFERVILCNSLVWSCSYTGKINLTYEEALQSEKEAKKSLSALSPVLKKALLYLVNQTHRGRVLDAFEDVFSYSKEHYFVGETVLAVIGNLWCHSKIIRVIQATEKQIEEYKQEQIKSGEYEKNDYLKDDTWGPPPELFRYEVKEIDPDDPKANQTHILDLIDVKREKLAITRDKCRFLVKSSTYYSEKDRVWRVKEDLCKALNLNNTKFDGEIFVGKLPIFEKSLGQEKSSAPRIRNSAPSTNSSTKNSSINSSTKINSINSSTIPKKVSPKPKSLEQKDKKPLIKSDTQKPKIPKKIEKVITPEELKLIELEKRAKEREQQKEIKKIKLEFKKLWLKPKEDLEVEDLKDLPKPDVVSCKIPNDLFGDFVMILEYFNCYSNILKVRDCFTNGLNFDTLERALLKSEVAGPLSDVLQILLRTIFRLQEIEDAEITKEEKADVELNIDQRLNDVSVGEAIEHATIAATWSLMYQNSPIHKLYLDHLSLTEVLRLHLLSSGARPSEKDVKWRFQMRGGYTCADDPGLQLRLNEPQILTKLAQGTVFDLSLEEKIKLIHCLIEQIMIYVDVRETIDNSFELFKKARMKQRTLQAAEKRCENEDTLWRQKLKADKLVPDANFMKNGASDESKKSENVRLLSDEQIEAFLAKKDREIAKRKQTYEWNIEEVMKEIHKHEKKLGLYPVGRDRAYRRYWIFSSVPGIFVEDDDEYVGPCLPNPPPQISNIDLDDMNFINANMEKLKAQEAESNNHFSKAPPKKKNSVVMMPQPPIFGLCNGDSKTCTVHSRTIPRPKWSFYWSNEALDALISSLSPRGIREKDLRQYLMDERSGVEALLAKCPMRRLNVQEKYPEALANATERRQPKFTPHSKVDTNLNYPFGTKLDVIFELQLRDLILEAEEKIFLGALGTLKVKDRGVWRKAIEERGYDKQVDSLEWGYTKSSSLNSSPGHDSAPVNEGVEQFNPVIRELASAILQVEQSLEAKFLRRPLGADEEGDKKKKSKAADNDSSKFKHNWVQGTPLDRWETSLMKSTSFSQLFMHIFTLDNSISWNKSVLNARCRVCRRKGDAESMVLCDKCSKGHHAYCLKPALDAVPKGVWLCSDCETPPEPQVRPKIKARNFINYEEESEEEGRSGDEGEEGEESDEGDEDEEDGPPTLTNESFSEVCEVCESGGEVICCDGCPRLYHLECLNPPRLRVPRGSWYCDACANSKKRGGKSKTKPKSRDNRNLQKKRSRRDLEETETSDEEEEEEEDETSEKEDSDENGSDEEQTPVKVKFSKTHGKKPNMSSGSGFKGKNKSEAESDDEDEEETSGRNRSHRGLKRKASSVALLKMSGGGSSGKRHRSDSKENEETSENSNDSTSSTSGGVRKTSIESSDSTGTLPKRTRLQKMNTNKCGDSGDLDNVLLDRLVSDLLKHPEAWPFSKPVTRSEAPDYHDVVKTPMDLGTIKYKLNSMVYTCNQEFLADLHLVFDNCFNYNSPTASVYKSGENLKLYCERRCVKAGIHFSDTSS